MKDEILELIEDPEMGIPQEFLIRLLAYVEGLEKINAELLKHMVKQ